MIEVQWVYPDRLLSTDDGFTADELKKAGRIPVVPLSALRKFLQAVSDKSYQQWKNFAEYADDPTDHDTLHADLMKHDPIYAKAQRLLASLGEQ